MQRNAQKCAERCYSGPLEGFKAHKLKILTNNCVILGKENFSFSGSRFPRLKTVFYLPHNSDTAPIIKIWIQIIHFYWSAEAIKTSQPFTQTKFLAQGSFLVQRFPSQQPGSVTLSAQSDRLLWNYVSGTTNPKPCAQVPDWDWPSNF